MVLGCAVLLSACGAGKAYNISANSWIGAPLDEMIAQWGKPDKILPQSEGQEEYVWIKTTGPHWVEPEMYHPPVQYRDEDDFEYFKRVHDDKQSYDSGGHYSTITCRTTVRVSADKRIVEISPESFLGLTDCRFVNAPPVRQTEPLIMVIANYHKYFPC